MAESPILYTFGTGLNENEGNVSVAYGSIAGTATEGNDNRLSALQTLIVKKNPGAGEFSSVKAAVDSISDASASKPYQVFIRAGIYIEDTITMKPFVNVRGVRNATIIEVDSPAKDLIIGTNNCEISECTLRGSTNAGKTLFRVSSTAAGDVFTIRDCLFGSADSFIIQQSANLAQVTVINCLSLTTADVSVGFKVGGAGYNILGVLGFSASIPLGRTVGKLFEVQGALTTVVSHCSGVMNSGGTLTTVFEIFDGATIHINSSAIGGPVTGLYVPNTGAAPILKVANFTVEAVTLDINILHPGATGFISGAWEYGKEYINPASSVSVFHSDPTPGIGIAVLGDIYQGGSREKSINFTKLLREGAATGLISGGGLEKGTGAFDLDIAAGDGFLVDSSGVVQEVTWEAETQTLSGAPIERVYIIVNENGLIQRVGSLPDFETVIILGRVVTNSAALVLIEDSYHSMVHWGDRVEEFLREGIGALFTGGCTLSENLTTALTLDMTSGEYYFGSKEFCPSGATPIEFAAVKRDGSGGFISAPGTTVVDNAFYDNDNPGGTLEAIPAGKYAKHTILLVGDGSKQIQFLIYAQAVYDSEGEAVAAPLSTEPADVKDALTRIAAVIVQEGNANVVSILDERPRLGFTSSSSQTSSDHGSLIGLGDDDHTLYLLASGTRSMAGNLNMGGNAITNVGTVDGITVSSHASRHLPNGDDPLTSDTAVGLDGDSSNTVGIQNSFARSDHLHAIATGVPVTQTPDAANAEGTSANLARADHAHNIPAAAPTANLSGDTTNQEGVANSFTRSDHAHAVDTAIPVTQNPDQSNAEGTAPGLARADHVHNIPAGVPSAITPDGGNAEGVATSFARTDHIHDLPASAPTTALSAATSNEEGVALSVARSDHSHELLTGTPSGQAPDEANAEGTSANLARADHIHNIPAEIAVTVGTANAEGSASTFSRSDHVHSHGDQLGGALHAVATQSINGFMSSNDKFLLDQVMAVKALIKEETGFPNFTDSEMSFDDVTKTFTIQPKLPATQFSYWINGTEYIKTGAESVVIDQSVAGGEGEHLFYYQGATLVADKGPPDVSIWRDVAFAALTVWDSTNLKHIRLGEERHGMAMSGATHEYLHLLEGTRYLNGLDPAAFYDGVGTLDPDVQFAIGNGEIRDEDIPLELINGDPQTLSPVAQVPIFYLLGANSYVRRKDADAFPLIYTGSSGYSGPNGRIPWNRDTGVGHTLQEAQENYYVPMHYFATNDLEEPYIGVQGRSEYVDLTTARDAALQEMLDIRGQLGPLGNEFAPHMILLFQTSSSYSNSTKARRVNMPSGDQFIDVRGLKISSGNTSGNATNNHGGLSGLNDDDHQHYLNRSGVRAMTGNLDMGTNNITNVGTVDGVTVSAHKDRHLPNGDDPLDNAAPQTNLTGDTTNDVGTANSLSRSDHVHAVDTNTPVSLPPDQVNFEGTASGLSRADHVHDVPAAIRSQQLADQLLSEGVAASFSRSDHIHNIPTATPVSLNPDGGNQQGSATSFSKSDHVHDVPADVPSELTPELGNAEGNSTSFSRANHIHNIPTNVALTLTPDLGNSEGTAASFSRSDHVHDIPAGIVSQQLADQTSTEGTATSFSRTDHIHNIPTSTPSTLTPDAGNSQGVSTSFAKADHIHDVPANTPVTIGVANSEGVATSFARSNHVHDHGQQTQTDLHALVTRTGHGFLSSTDKTKLDQMGTGVIQGYSSANITLTSATFVTLSLLTAHSNYPNSLLTKVSATDFRADFSGAVDISYHVTSRPVVDNDRATEVAVFKNGTRIVPSTTRQTSKRDANKESVAAANFVDDCSNGDVYTLRANSPTGSNILILATHAFMSVKVFRIGL